MHHFNFEVALKYGQASVIRQRPWRDNGVLWWKQRLKIVKFQPFDMYCHPRSITLLTSNSIRVVSAKTCAFGKIINLKTFSLFSCQIEDYLGNSHVKHTKKERQKGLKLFFVNIYLTAEIESSYNWKETIQYLNMRLIDLPLLVACHLQTC